MSGQDPLSDKNITNVRASVVSKTRQYSDLDLSLTIHPVFGDIRPLTDIRAVKNAVKILVLSNFGERPFRPKLGSNLTGVLFENVTPLSVISIEDEIKRVIYKFEPRVNAVVVDVVDLAENNAYDVTITFNVISLNVRTDVNILLERIR